MLSLAIIVAFGPFPVSKVENLRFRVFSWAVNASGHDSMLGDVETGN